MKELSIEEKAKAYDIAVEEIGKLRDTLIKERIIHENGVININFQRIFPELMESEDERVRKEITELVMQPTWKTEKEFHRRKELCTWLENQCEQKPIFRVGDYIRNTKTGDKVLIEQLDIATKAYCYVSYDGAAVNHSDFSFSKQDEWELIGQKNIKQKSAENSEKVSEYTTAEKDRGGYNVGFECGKQRVLKNPEDFGLCKKPEWSEEDEKKRTLLINILEVNHPNGYFLVNHANMEAMHTEELVSWLKSLKERIQPKPIWKPTDEQMKLLREVQQALLGKDCHNRFVNFMYELKRLKDE